MSKYEILPASELEGFDAAAEARVYGFDFVPSKVIARDGRFVDWAGGEDDEAKVAMLNGEAEHTFDALNDRCGCGGEVVFYEDGDDQGVEGYGCEMTGLVYSDPKIAENGR